MKSVKLEILKMMIEDLERSDYVVPKYGGYQYNDVLSVIKSLKDNDVVKVTPSHIRLINKTDLPKKLEMVKKYYF